MPLIGTRGAASAQGFGEFAQQTAANYIEDVFSTYLYSGNSSTQTITNGLDISGKGGLVWLKMRSNAQYHYLFDTARGPLYSLSTNTTDQSYSIGNTVTAFNSNGFNLGLNSATNGSGDTFVSWSFREQPKFFDIVTYTGNGSNDRQISHNLQSTPGFIIVKRTDSAGYEWTCWQRTQTGYFLFLNTTDARFADTGSNKAFNTGTPMSSTTFSVGAYSNVNANGGTYVAYLFAHDAGGFGTAGTDNVISCGSVAATSGSTTNVNLGFEPQWILFRDANNADNWKIVDTMRDFSMSSQTFLFPNKTDADTATSGWIVPTATGFQALSSFNTSTYIYIAIRRGPMKTPTSGTSVFQTSAWTGNATSGTRLITGFGYPTDLAIFSDRQNIGGYQNVTYDRLRGTTSLGGLYLITSSTATEGTNLNSTSYENAFRQNNGFLLGDVTFNYSGRTYVGWQFGRAPGFMDVVCYAGTSSVRTVNHNLTVAPELIITKVRTPSTSAWYVYAAPLGATKFLVFNATDAQASFSALWNDTAPTSTVFTLGNNTGNNEINRNMVAYLFASCPGVSKVGSYTGTGGTQTISCGFAARWVMIKRTDSTGDWWVWDTARGMVAGTDPRLAFNLTSAETNANWVYTDASGFQIVTTDATVNASGGSYIFLAVA